MQSFNAFGTADQQYLAFDRESAVSYNLLVMKTTVSTQGDFKLPKLPAKSSGRDSCQMIALQPTALAAFSECLNRATICIIKEGKCDTFKGHDYHDYKEA